MGGYWRGAQVKRNMVMVSQISGKCQNIQNPHVVWIPLTFLMFLYISTAIQDPKRNVILNEASDDMDSDDLSQDVSGKVTMIIFPTTPGIKCSICYWYYPLGGHSHTWRWYGTSTGLTPFFDILWSHWVPFYAQLDHINLFFLLKKLLGLYYI